MNRLTFRIDSERSVLVVVAVILSVAAAACGDSRANGSPAVVPETAGADTVQKPARASVNGKGPARTLVVLEPLFEHEFVAATGPTYMDQTGLEFIPALLTAKTGQTVQLRNNEDVLHNVRVQETGTHVPVFNVATTPNNSYIYAFEKPGYYDVTCDIHAAMRATILVTATPYVNVADDAGRFAFEDVVPGPYTVTWFETGQRRNKQVEILRPDTHVALP